MIRRLETSKEWLLYRLFEFKDSGVSLLGGGGVLANVWDLPPEKAIEAFEAKGYKISWSWRDTWKEAHAKAFTVAKAMKADILSDIRGAVDKAHKDGLSFRSFQKEIAPILKAKGWWGKVPADQVPHDPESPPPQDAAGMVWLGTPWRLQTIFRTNLQSSMMAGRYAQMKSQIKARPYWQYIAVMDSQTRPDHARMNGKVFLATDPVWDTWYPPNGFNCRCRVKSMSMREIVRDGKLDNLVFTDGILKDSKGNTISPDEGFDYNPGEASRVFLERLAEKKTRALEKEIKGKLQTSSTATPAGYIPADDGDFSPLRGKMAPIDEARPMQVELPKPKTGSANDTDTGFLPPDDDASPLRPKYQADPEGRPMQVDAPKEPGKHIDIGAAQAMDAGFLPPEDDVPALRKKMFDDEEIAPASASMPLGTVTAKAQEPLTNFPDDLRKLSVVETLGGSTGAKKVKDDQGKTFVMKSGANKEHLLEETYADAAYQAAGIAVPRFRVYQDTNGNPVKLSEFMDGTKSLKAVMNGGDETLKADVVRQVRDGFIVDAMFGNWDVVGLSMDNILVDKAGRAWRVDNGGSFRFRAQGARKTDAQWNGEVSELKTLVDSSKNKTAAQIFKGITQDEIARQISDVLTKRDAILAAVPEEIREVLQKRFAYLEGKIGK